MYSKILVPLDLSHKDDYWLKTPLVIADGIARQSNGSIHLMSAVPYHALEAFYPNIFRHEIAEKAKADLAAIATRYCRPDAHVEIDVAEGGTIEVDILNAARELSADLIVMPTHMPTARDYLLGSHAARIALHAPCSVMVVRKPEPRATHVPLDDVEAPLRGHAVSG